MRFTTKILLFATLSLFCLSPYTTVPTVAFIADSYQNQVGDEFIWDVRESTGYFLYGNVNATDQIKMVITATNQSLILSQYWDTVYAKFYIKSATESEWSPWTGEELIAAYLESYGILPIHLILFVVPHNESAIIQHFSYFATSVFGGYDWMSGENGYDGYGGYWSFDITAPGAIKVEMHFNANATLTILKVYNSTGTSWVLRFHMEIYIPPVPGFPITSVVFILTIFVAVYVLRLKRKPEIMI